MNILLKKIYFLMILMFLHMAEFNFGIAAFHFSQNFQFMF